MSLRVLGAAPNRSLAIGSVALSFACEDVLAFEGENIR